MPKSVSALSQTTAANSMTKQESNAEWVPQLTRNMCHSKVSNGLILAMVIHAHFCWSDAWLSRDKSRLMVLQIGLLPSSVL